MEPLSTSVIVGTTAMLGNKAVKIFEDLIYRRIYGFSREELDASNKEKAKDIIAVKEATRDLIVKSEIIKIQREYKNLGKTLSLASPYITSEENKIKEENDFFWGILEHSKKISNEEMQVLISKIVAGEYNNPETYSMSTLQVLKSVDGKLLNNFTKILGVCLIGIGIIQDIFSDVEDMKKLDVSYSHFLELQNIGLICANVSEIETDKDTTGVYISKQVHFIPKDKTKKMVIPSFYSLTRAGREIARHLNIKENPNFIGWLKDEYKDNDYRNFDIETR